MWTVTEFGNMATVFEFPYRTVAEIRLENLLRNLHSLRGHCRKEIIPVVKADAYGHGLWPIAKSLVHHGSCQTLAVATLEEAIEVRKKLAAPTILVLSGFFPHQLDAFLKYRLVPVIHYLPHLKSLLGRKTLPEIHLKFDSGMHRLGLLPDEVREAAHVLERMHIKLAGLATHFAESESVVSNFSDQQLAVFMGVYDTFREHNLLHTDAKIHVANSGGILRGKWGPATAVRPGLALYGISPNQRLVTNLKLLPVLSWKTRILSLKSILRGDTVGYGRTYKAKRKEKIAIVPVGYADGYPRLLSNKGQVLIAGRRASVRGRVSMDLIAVDVSHIPSAKEGTEVILIGESGKDEIGATDIANWADTIAYEVLCGLSPRVPRLYLED